MEIGVLIIFVIHVYDDPKNFLVDMWYDTGVNDDIHDEYTLPKISLHNSYSLWR